VNIYIYIYIHIYIYIRRSAASAGRWRRRQRCILTLHVEYAERGNEYGILFMFSLFCEYIHLAYVRIHIVYGVHQAGYGIHILVVAPQEYVNVYSTRRVLTKPHTGKEKPHPGTATEGSKPCVAKCRRLGGCVHDAEDDRRVRNRVRVRVRVKVNLKPEI